MDIIHTQTVNDGQFTMLKDQEILGYIKYEWAKNGNLKATGTFVDEAQRGKNLGNQLLDVLVDYAKENNLKIYPICPYVVKMFENYPKYVDIVDQEFLN